MSNMKVFISWSGKASEEIGEIISEWLKYTLMNIEPVFTPNYIKAGSRGRDMLYNILEDVYTGILIYTSESLNSEWILFEAGAMHANAASSVIIPLIFDVSYSDLPGPLQAFQFKEFNKKEMFQVLEAVNERRGEQQVDKETLQYVFDREWDHLKERVDAVLQKIPTQQQTKDEQDLLQKVLELTERVAVQQKELNDRPSSADDNTESSMIPPLTVEEMVRQFGLLVDQTVQNNQHNLLHPTLNNLGKPLYFITHKLFRNESRVVKEMRNHMLKLREWMVVK